MKTLNTLKIIAFSAVFISACKKDKEDVKPIVYNTVPEFFKSSSDANVYGKTLPDFVMIANSTSKINLPQDLDFNTDPLRPNELWIINKGTESSGGTTVMLTDVGLSTQKFDFRKDGNAWHFMSLPSGIAFSPTNYTWVTTPNVLDANHNNGTFTGPSLWSSDLSIYAKPTTGNGSHLDMLHGSPYSMGVAAEKDYIFWVFDGYNKHLCKYDYVATHAPGGDDHSAGKLFRYKEVILTKTTIPSHLVLDNDKKWLYIVDGGKSRILRVDITTGTKKRDLPTTNEPLTEYAEMSGVKWEVFSDINLQKPCGIEIVADRLFVTDYQTGEIIAYNVSTKNEVARINTGKMGIMGIKADKDGKLWYVNASTNELYKVEPK